MTVTTKASNSKTSSNKTLWMAYNHNGTALMKEPGSKRAANKELREYTQATGNAGSVDEFKAPAKKRKVAKVKSTAKTSRRTVKESSPKTTKRTTKKPARTKTNAAAELKKQLKANLVAQRKLASEAKKIEKKIEAQDKKAADTVLADKVAKLDDGKYLFVVAYVDNKGNKRTVTRATLAAACRVEPQLQTVGTISAINNKGRKSKVKTWTCSPKGRKIKGFVWSFVSASAEKRFTK